MPRLGRRGAAVPAIAAIADIADIADIETQIWNLRLVPNCPYWLAACTTIGNGQHGDRGRPAASATGHAPPGGGAVSDHEPTR
jgi:hypothetical protein